MLAWPKVGVVRACAVIPSTGYYQDAAVKSLIQEIVDHERSFESAQRIARYAVAYIDDVRTESDCVNHRGRKRIGRTVEFEQNGIRHLTTRSGRARAVVQSPRRHASDGIAMPSGTVWVWVRASCELSATSNRIELNWRRRQV